MNKYLAPILTIAIVASLAGVLYIRANVDRSGDVNEEQAAVVGVAPTAALLYVVRAADETDAVMSYDLVSGKAAEADRSVGEFVWPVRFNQSSFVCVSADELNSSKVSLRVMCDIGRDNTLLLAAYDGDKTVLTANIDPRDLGVSPSAAEGYLVPIAVAADKSAIYLGRRVETESWVAGLWKLDVATGKVSEIAYVRDHSLYEYDINPATKELIGATFMPPESLGDWLSGPSELHLVDLVTGDGASLEALAKDYYENPMLSDDATRYAFHEAGPSLGDGRTVVLPRATGRVADGWEIDGVLKDWFGDILVFDRDGNLFLYDLKTESETQITHETDATVEYVGVVK